MSEDQREEQERNNLISDDRSPILSSFIRTDHNRPYLIFPELLIIRGFGAVITVIG